MKIFPVTRFGTISSPFDMLNTFDKMFDETFSAYPTENKTTAGLSVTTVPRANVVKKDDNYVIELAAPGFSRDEFIIDVENNTLSVSVNAEDTKEHKDMIQMREYRYHAFSRSWTLPEGTSVEQITANYEAGILFVNVPVEGIKDTKRIINVS